jgi:hypothetical protein
MLGDVEVEDASAIVGGTTKTSGTPSAQWVAA